MIQSLQEIIHNDPVLLLFIVLGIGYIIGNLKTGSFQLGSVAGVLIAGLIFGNFGFESNPALQSFGFVLFIFSVGYQAGPNFISSIKKDGKKYFAIALVVACTGFLLAFGLSRYFNFESGVSAGILSGSLTSSPTLAAADAAANSSDFVSSDGLSNEAVRTNINTSYAITYVFGLIGLILIIRILPRLLKINLRSEAEKLEKEDQKSKLQPVFSPSDLTVRAFRVESDDIIGVPLDEMYDKTHMNITIHKIIRKGEDIEPKGDTTLEFGDLISVVGVMSKSTMDALKNKTFGPLARKKELLEFSFDSVRISVTKKDMVGKTLGELKIPLKYASFVSSMRRLGVDIEVEQNTKIEIGDVLDVSGPAYGLDMLGEKLGHVERDEDDTDLRTFSWSIVAGILLGTITVTFGGITLGLGSAGGLLGVGLLIGYLRSVFPVFGRVPAGAQWIFNELGLLLFMAGVGLRGGAGLIDVLMESGLSLFLSGVIVTTTPLIVAYFIGRKLLKMNPLMLLGTIIGAMTSGGALSALNDQSKSSIASIGYTGAYAIANILLTLAGALLVLL